MSVLTESVEKFTADPGTGRITPAVTATAANGHTRLSTGPFNFECDLPPAVGGGGTAPSPTAYLLGALAGCAVTFISSTLAPQFGVEIDELSATARCESSLAALLGVDGTDPELTGISIEITVSSQSPVDRVDAMRRAWTERCPVYLSLVRPMAVDVRFA
ncbi:OsmC family protein [Pseudonocardia sp. D17]|uniref:OsmC family protein n=1 Tax=Pseudonocardia sp. D17 TaxID=882661 RepID=UPI002B36D0F5|nr:hypothetical protein PSD17_14740 [Pseudonocardia sp. D17]